jgi:hypothetical protein
MLFISLHKHHKRHIVTLYIQIQHHPCTNLTPNFINSWFLDEGKKIRFLDEGKKIKSWQLLEFVLRGLQFQAKTLEALKGLEFKGKIRLNK